MLSHRDGNLECGERSVHFDTAGTSPQMLCLMLNRVVLYFAVCCSKPRRFPLTSVTMSVSYVEMEAFLQSENLKLFQKEAGSAAFCP